MKNDVKLSETVDFCDPIQESDNEEVNDSFGENLVFSPWKKTIHTKSKTNPSKLSGKYANKFVT